jgi:WD40-like Beta Propeller Repeat
VETGFGRRIRPRGWGSCCLVAAALASGCATLTPLFTPAVTASFAHQDIRKLETPSLELYYPADRRSEALRVAERLETCLAHLRTLTLSQEPRAPLIVYLTTANFDNAYVQPPFVGLPPQMVLASHMTLELFDLFDFGTNGIPDIACHEATHYVQFQQNDGLWALVDVVFGDVYAPNFLPESWFLEGLATFYEGRLDKSVGRPHSPLWHGLFESVAAIRGGELEPGDLVATNRQFLPVGANYLVGEYFVKWLARTYGDEKLWQFVNVQGHSWLSPLGVTLRFKEIYGLSIGALLAEFSKDLARTALTRHRPLDQQVVDDSLGYFARATASADGHLAVVLAGLDTVAELRIRAPDGRLLLVHPLGQLWPGRPYIATNPVNVSGLSFSPDGRRLYFVLADVAEDGTSTPRLLELDSASGEYLRRWDDLEGIGGGLTADGRGYLYVRSQGDTGNLYRLDLETGTRTPLTHFTGNVTLSGPRASPDGRLLVYSRRSDDGFDLWLLASDGTTRPLTRDGRFNYDARWVDNTTLVALREVDGRAQVARLDVQTEAIDVVTNVPYGALDPSPLPDGRLALVNRYGYGWTLDEVPMPPRPSPLPSATEAEEEEPMLPPLPERSWPAGDTLLARDAPAPGLEDFWIPTLRTPFFAFSTRSTSSGGTEVLPIIGVSVQGVDRLGLNAYAINVAYQSHDPGPSFNVGYGNYNLAPLWLSMVAARAAEPGLVDYSLTLAAQETFWTTPVTLSFLLLRRDQADIPTPLRATLGGPGISTVWEAVETTPYGGVRLGLLLAGQSAYYPLGTLHFGDVGATVGGWLPLPWWDRDNLFLNVRGRALPGAPSRLLQVGGTARGIFEVHPGPQRAELGPNLAIFPDISFIEPLQGYEDTALRTDSVLIAGGLYTLPLIIDRGWASVLWVLPSLFLRQVDLQAFGNVAWTHDVGWNVHRVAGGAVLLRTTFGGALALSFYYQFAWRFDDGLGALNTFGVALE